MYEISYNCSQLKLKDIEHFLEVRRLYKMVLAFDSTVFLR